MAIEQDKTTAIRRQVALGTVANYAGRTVILGVWFVVTPVILRDLGTTQFGLWALFTSFVAYGGLADLGIASAITKYVAELRAREDNKTASELIATSLCMYCVLGLLLIAISAAIAPFVPDLVNVPVNERTTTSWLVFVTGVSGAAQLPSIGAFAVLRGLNRYDLMNLVASLAILSVAVGSLLVLSLGGHVLALAILILPLNILWLIPTVWLIRRVAPELHFGFRGARMRHARQVLGFGSALFVIQAAGVVKLQTDEVVIGSSLAVRDVSPYSIARRLSTLPGQLAAQFVAVLLPLASRLHAEGDVGYLREIYLSGLRITLALFAVVGGALIVFAKPLLVAWAPSVASSADIIVLLTVAALVEALISPVSQALQAMNRHRPLVVFSVGSAVLNLALSIALVGPMGVRGVALGTIIATSIEAAIVVYFGARVLSVRAGDIARQVLLPGGLPLLPMGAVLFLIRSTLAPSTVPGIALAGIAGAIVYTTGYLLLPGTRSERAVAERIMRFLFARLPAVLRGGRASAESPPAMGHLSSERELSGLEEARDGARPVAVDVMSPDEVRAFLDAPRVSTGRPLYLALEPDPVFAMLHTPAEAGSPRLGVLMCPAFGWAELGSHRTVRAFADLCATRGYAALRVDLPGTGDSGGSPRTPHRLDAWRATINAGARLLRSTGCERIVVFGIGLGGMLACEAVSAGAEIDDLLLWEVPARGDLLLRELRALARLVRSIDGDAPAREPAAEPADGALEAAGFVLSAETVEDLRGLDLTTLELGAAAGDRRVLLAGGDRPPDERLRAAFERAGVALTCSDGTGFGGMMVDPRFSVVPHEMLAEMLEWLGQAPPARSGAQPTTAEQAVEVVQSITIDTGRAEIRESPFEFHHEGCLLTGVLCEPVSAPSTGICAVLSNSGCTRRIGPHRIWVDIARRWAELGVTTLRLDLATIGDSDGEERTYLSGELHSSTFAAQLRGALDALQRSGRSGFLLCGLCSSAFWSFHAALEDERVDALLLLNPSVLFWSDGVSVVRDIRRARSLFAQRRFRQLTRLLVEERWRIWRAMRTLVPRLLRPGAAARTPLRFDQQIAAALDTLDAAGTDVTLVLATEERLYDDLATGRIIERSGEWPHLRIDRIDAGHVFRSVAEQRGLIEMLDREVSRLVGVVQAEQAAQ